MEFIVNEFNHIMNVVLFVFILIIVLFCCYDNIKNF